MTTKCRIAIVTSHLEGRAVAYEWMIKYLSERNYEILFYHIASKGSNYEEFIKSTGVNYKRIDYRGSSKFEMIKVIILLILSFIKNKPSVVHTHYFDANLIGLTAAKFAFIRKRIYTRHTTTQRYRYLKGTYNFEKYFNKISTHIVSISDVVTNVLKNIESVPDNKIIKIYHGFDLKMFNNIDTTRVQMMRNKYHYNDSYPVIGSISRYDEWKGVEYTIQAFAKILNHYPNAVLILANADGIRKEYMHQLLSQLPKNSFREIKYEDDIFALIKTFDVFVHVPIDEEIEAFGQVYIEVMASSVPMICTLSGVAGEIIKNEFNALVVNYQDTNSIYEALKIILSDDSLKEKVILNARKNLEEKFDVSRMINSLDQLYKK